MNYKSLTKIFEILLKDQGDQVGCIVTSDFDLQSEIVAGSMVAILEAVLGQLDDSIQIETEEQILSLFQEMVAERHNFTYKEPIDDADEYD